MRSKSPNVSPNKSIHVVALVIGLLLSSMSLYAQGLPPLTHGLTLLKKPYDAPELKLKDLDDAVVDIQQMKGKVIIINFWATWCPPCRREMGSLERLHQATAGKGVAVIAVNIGEDEDTVFSFLGLVEPSPNFTIVLDQSGESMDRWKVKGLPTTFIVDPNGRVIYRAVGGREFDHPKLIDKVVALIGK